MSMSPVRICASASATPTTARDLERARHDRRVARARADAGDERERGLAHHARRVGRREIARDDDHRLVEANGVLGRLADERAEEAIADELDVVPALDDVRVALDRVAADRTSRRSPRSPRRRPTRRTSCRCGSRFSMRSWSVGSASIISYASRIGDASCIALGMRMLTSRSVCFASWTACLTRSSSCWICASGCGGGRTTREGRRARARDRRRRPASRRCPSA